jgi:capsule polysaccharide export protein KpsE/RkpR
MTDMYEISKSGVVNLDAMKAARVKKDQELGKKYAEQFEQLLDHVFNHMIKNCHYDSIHFNESDVAMIVDQYQRAMKDLIDILVKEEYLVVYEKGKVGIEWIKVSGWA